MVRHVEITVEMQKYSPALEVVISRSFQNTCVNRLQLGMMLRRVIIYDGVVSRMRGGIKCVRVV